MMQGAAPQEQEDQAEDQKKMDKVVQIMEGLMDEWKKTGKIQEQKITDEKEARRAALGIAMRMADQEEDMAEKEMQAPQQAPPQGGPMGGPMGGGPQGGPMMM